MRRIRRTWLVMTSLQAILMRAAVAGESISSLAIPFPLLEQLQLAALSSLMKFSFLAEVSIL